MKKTWILYLAILLGSGLYAQPLTVYNEIKLNIANTLAIASVEVGYERFIDWNQSVDMELLINDRMNYHSEKGSRNFKTTSVKLGYVYYFGQETFGSGFYVNPFGKYRFGEFEETLVTADVEEIVTTDMSGFIVGIGLGYKWNFSDSFVLGPYGGIGRNFNSEVQDRFTAMEFHAGFGIGYRF